MTKAELIKLLQESNTPDTAEIILRIYDPSIPKWTWKSLFEVVPDPNTTGIIWLGSDVKS